MPNVPFWTYPGGRTVDTRTSLQPEGWPIYNSDILRSLARSRLDSGPPDAATVELIDRLWGGYIPSRAPHTYFDYYFSGQDIKVYIDGTEDEPEFFVVPIINFGFNIEQQKQPVYGFWSYTYDCMMRGTRLVHGQFTMATRDPNYMKRMLSKAADTRVQVRSPWVFRDITDDDANINKYWGKNIDPSLNSQGQHIFSVHPPFNFVIVYGVQSASLTQSGALAQQQYLDYQTDNPLMLDTNDRLVESDPLSQKTRIILDACELISMETNYGPDGQVVAETYAFLARDAITPTGPAFNGMMTSGQAAALPAGQPA